MGVDRLHPVLPAEMVTKAPIVSVFCVHLLNTDPHRQARY